MSDQFRLGTLADPTRFTFDWFSSQEIMAVCEWYDIREAELADIRFSVGRELRYRVSLGTEEDVCPKARIGGLCVIESVDSHEEGGVYCAAARLTISSLCRGYF